ncbi:MAG: BON domain-containing protein [Alphaproteobacteria bacterium]|nr:BON domain-containing protein [Alphaproteobacteria bacterium]
MKKLTLLSVAASSILLSSCALGLATGAGVAVGTAAVQEGGISRAASDARIQTEINSLWFRDNMDIFTKLDLTVNQGRVLITGVVQDPQHRVDAVRLAWQPAGVKQVINEIKVANSEGIVGFAKDVWISGRIRTALIFDKEIESINYSVDTVQGSVYLMGFAQDQKELNRVIEKARTIEGVKQVVNYVKLVGTPDMAEGTPPPDFGGGANSYNAAGQNYGDTSANGAPVAPVADGDPIDWSQDSIYER